MKNNNLSYSLEDLDIFTPELKGWKLHFFTVSSIVVAITTLVAQITVYRSLKRLGSRHINLMIYPSQVSEARRLCDFKKDESQRGMSM